LSLKRFAEEERDLLFKGLESYLKGSTSKIKKHVYLEMMRQRGEEPDPAKIPASFEDLEVEAQIALNIYNRLGNRVSESGFLGKDYTILPRLIKIFHISDDLLLLDLLNTIENFYIEESSKYMKAELDKMKKSNK